MFECSALVKEYGLGEEEPAYRALAGVDLKIGDGEFIAVTGPSGCGKSTLLHLLGALDRPSAGLCAIAGQDTRALDDDSLSRLRRDKIGFVFQAFHLLPRLSALDNVCLPMVYARRSRRERQERARELLDQVGLGGKWRSTPLQLSGGERQRVAIARALANDAPTLLADEPTGNLDTRTGLGILDLFERLGASGKTVVLVSHDPAVAARAGRRIRLSDGRVAEGAA
jgi:ABC-type lipoprotein export system ATPase subunit